MSGFSQLNPLPVANGGTGVTTSTGSTSTVRNTSPTLVTPVLGAATATSLTFNPTTGGIVGTTTNDNAGTGKVGEVLNATAALQSVSPSNNIAIDITSIDLTAGDWEITGHAAYLPAAATTVTCLYASIGVTSATANNTLGQFSGVNYPALVLGNTVYSTVTIPSFRVSLSATTTYYLVGLTSFGVNTITVGGTMHARRLR